MTDQTADHAPGQRPGFDEHDIVSDNLLRHYVGVLRRRYRWVLLGLVAGLLAGFVAASTVKKPPPVTHYYKATSSIIAASGGGGNSDAILQQALIYAQSSTFATDFAQKYGVSNTDAVQLIRAQPSNTTTYPSLDITALATNPTRVVTLANGAAQLIIDNTNKKLGATNSQTRAQLNTQLQASQAKAQKLAAQIAAKPANVAQLQSQLDDTTNQISDIQSQLASIPETQGVNSLVLQQPAIAIEINAAGYNYRIGQNQNARSPIQSGTQNSNNDEDAINELDLSRSVPMSKSTRVALGGAAGLVLGLISAFLFEAWDDRVRRRDDVERITKHPVLAEIPVLGREAVRTHDLVVTTDNAGPIGERYRRARTALSLVLDSLPDAGHAPVLLVTSPGPGDGKTTSTANIAAAFAEAGRNTLVIDGDFRRPTIRRHLAPVPNLIDPDSPDATVMEGLSFLAGPHKAPNPGVAIATLEQMIATWRTKYDLIVLDTPPILTTNDAADLLHVADVVVVVVRAGTTRRRQTKRVVNLLERLQANIAGLILNACERQDMDDYYGYGYGYYLRKGGKSYGYFGQESSNGSTHNEDEPSRNGHRDIATATTSIADAQRASETVE